MRSIYLLDNETVTEPLIEKLTGLNIDQLYANDRSVSAKLFFFNSTHQQPQNKNRRNVQSTGQDDIDHCTFRTKTNEGYTIGDFILLASEALENPLLSVAETIHDTQNPQTAVALKPNLPNWLRFSLSIINLFADTIISLVAGPFYSIAKYLSVTGLKMIAHSLKQDEYCFKQIFTVDALTKRLTKSSAFIRSFKGARPHINHNRRQSYPFRIDEQGLLEADTLWVTVNCKPAEYVKMIPLYPKGTLIQESLHNHINTIKTIQLTVNQERYSLVMSANESYFLSDRKDDLKPDIIPVYFDEKRNELRLDHPQSEINELDYTITDGGQFIELYGQPVPIIHNQENNTVTAIINRTDQPPQYIPLYMEPLSKQWHLSIYNNHSVFNKRQQDLINKIAFNPIKSNYQPYLNIHLNRKLHGNGRIYYNATENLMIEINGKLAYVDLSLVHEQFDYSIYQKQNNKQTYRVEWDGRRWIFYYGDSVHLSPLLKKTITASQFEQHNLTNLLSPPDCYGLRYDDEGHAFLRVKSHDVRIEPHHHSGNKHRFYPHFTISAAHKQPRIHLYFKNNLFNIATLEERLEAFFDTPFGQRHGSVLDTLKKQRWLNEKSAKRLLNAYHFPSSGLYSAAGFAIDIEQTGLIPAWAHLFEKTNRSHSATESQLVESVSVFINRGRGFGRRVLKLRQHDSACHLCDRSGNIYLDDNYFNSSDHRYFIKKYIYNTGMTQRYINFNESQYAEREAERFRHYFGERSAQVFISNTNDTYLRLYRIPTPVSAFSSINRLPPQAAERFIDMLEKLKLLGINYNDITIDDLVWDQKTNTFYPINLYKIAPYHERVPYNPYEKELNRQTVINIITHITATIERSPSHDAALLTPK